MVVTEAGTAANPVGAGQVKFDRVPKTWNSVMEYPLAVPRVIPLIFTNLALTVPLDSAHLLKNSGRSSLKQNSVTVVAF